MTIAYRFMAGLLFASPFATPIQAKTFVAQVTSDFPDFSPADGLCSWKQQTNPDEIDPAAFCSLRAAIMQANATPEADTIKLIANATYNLSLAIALGVDTPETGDLDITAPLRIETLEPWPAAPATINANGIDRVFETDLSSVDHEVRLVNLIITGGSTMENGTGVLNFMGTLRLDHTVVVNNSSLNGQEGALGCAGNNTQSRLFLITSAVHSNIGDGVLCAITMDHAAIFKNSGHGVHSSSYISISNSTISNNYTGVIGGYDADVTIIHSTIVGSYGSGLLLSSTSSVTLINNVFSSNLSGTCYQQKPASFFAVNNLYDDDSCFPIGPGDPNRFNLPARLSGLGYHGGPTPTHRLHTDSPAIDTAAYCLSEDGTDQRGWPRPVDFKHLMPARCDIGALELESEVIFWDDFEKPL